MSTQPTPGATAEACALTAAKDILRFDVNPNSSYTEDLANCSALITRHFAPLLARVAELENTLEIWRKDYRLMEHRTVTCGILASHEPLEAVLKEPYTGKWASQQSEKVIALRKQLAAAKGAVSTLKDISEHLDADNDNSYRSDDREGAMDTCYAVAKQALAACAAAGLKEESK